MKNNQNRVSGFTILEMLVALIIIGILVSFAVFDYARALERMRVADVMTLMGTVRSAQDRSMLNRHHFTPSWYYLDASPSQITAPGTPNDFFNEDRTEFYTRGGYIQQNFPPSFKVYFEKLGNDRWFVVAKRIGRGDYDYTLVRDFESVLTVCVPNAAHKESALLCADFMGVETPEDLPPDPRTLVE